MGDRAVLSVTQFHAGTAFNVLPDQAVLRGTFRCFERHTRDIVREQVVQMATSIAAGYGATADTVLVAGVPATLNWPDQFRLARKVAVRVVGEQNVTKPLPTVASED